MFCPGCKEQGLKSKIYVGASTTTLLGFTPFYDEEGNYHCHDPNTITTSYSCSNGHRWQEYSWGECWCGWSNKEK